MKSDIDKKKHLCVNIVLLREITKFSSITEKTEKRIIIHESSLKMKESVFIRREKTCVWINRSIFCTTE
jgi:hypothetical protein